MAGNAHAFANPISFPSARAGRPSSPSGSGFGKQQFLVQSCELRPSYVSQAARLLGPPTRFEASKLKVVFLGDDMEKQPLSTALRAYTLTHCDFTANLTLAVYNNMNNNKLREWQATLQKDDVVAEWKNIKDEVSLHVHCSVSGSNLLQQLTAEFRYHIFSKELPLVLQAVVHGDSALFAGQPELMDSKVWVYFHSKSKEYNRVECWGSLKDAQQRSFKDRSNDVHNNTYDCIVKWASPETVFHAIIAILL
ncbi:hypothetical protein KSP39_PZI003883 [Platanthera zijinensis]|uniref:Staygreen protein domain-containing protein n=1 Tax=Platanthera zijinensis TaxID=2320716 RepID=A0AAP0BXD5_9ASPA